MDTLAIWLKQRATWPLILVLLILSVLILVVLFPLASPATFVPPHKPLDVQMWYGAAEVQTHMAALSPAERNAAAWSHLTVDAVFPFVYGLLLALLLVKAWPESRLWQLALAVIAADLMENIWLAALYWAYPQGLSWMAPVAGLWTSLKWTLVAVSLFMLIRGAFDRWADRVVARAKES